MVAGRPTQHAPLETLTFERDRCVFFAYKNITLGVWVGQANLAAAQAADRAGRMMAARHRTGRSYVGIILDGVPPPTPEAAELLTSTMGQRDTLVYQAYVVEGSGFWASGLRALVTNLYRESGAAGRLMVGTSVEEVAAWLSARHQEGTAVAVSEAELRDVLVKARATAHAASR